MVEWEQDWRFRRVAELVWREDFRLATAYPRPKGWADAERRLQCRWEGYRALELIARLKGEGERIARQVQHILGSV